MIDDDELSTTKKDYKWLYKHHIPSPEEEFEEACEWLYEQPPINKQFNWVLVEQLVKVRTEQEKKKWKNPVLPGPYNTG